MCGLREGYGLKIFNSIKFKLTFICLISGKPSQITGALSIKQNGLFQGGIWPEKSQLDQIQNVQLEAIIDFNMVNP